MAYNYVTKEIIGQFDVPGNIMEIQTIKVIIAVPLIITKNDTQDD